MIFMHYWLICYDLDNDKERKRLFKCLKRYGMPVQESVFEVSFPAHKQSEHQRMLREIDQITCGSGNVRFYSLNQECLNNCWALDGKPFLHHPGAIIL